MGVFDSFNISASGMTAQRLRMDVISNNIANVNTTRTEDGGPFRRQMVVFAERGGRGNRTGRGVQVVGIQHSTTPLRRMYNPDHPDADADGYVLMPNVDLVKEMVDMIEASRAYEANVTALQTTKDMALKALQIGK
ncbi:MAG: flagellar basal body rod protein FlgC [Halanaerobium sp.]|nr:flagellar basal body rod protein FlgC [Halanaerobium sp.]